MLVSQLSVFVIQLQFVEDKQRQRRVKISRGICTLESRLDGFSRIAQAKNWIKVTGKKMADNLNHISDDEESEWDGKYRFKFIS